MLLISINGLILFKQRELIHEKTQLLLYHDQMAVLAELPIYG